MLGYRTNQPVALSGADRGKLTSAARNVRIFAGTFRDVQLDDVFSHGGVDAHGRGDVFHGSTASANNARASLMGKIP